VLVKCTFCAAKLKTSSLELVKWDPIMREALLVVLSTQRLKLKNSQGGRLWGPFPPALPLKRLAAFNPFFGPAISQFFNIYFLPSSHPRLSLKGPYFGTSTSMPKMDFSRPALRVMARCMCGRCLPSSRCPLSEVGRLFSFNLKSGLKPWRRRCFNPRLMSPARTGPFPLAAKRH
jgi:hypothetical protein